MDVGQVAADLAAEQESLDDVVAVRPEEDWAVPTPSPRWTVAHQIAHLAYFDEAAALAITDPEAFRAAVAELGAAAVDGHEAVDDFTLSPLLALGPAGLLEHWREARRRLGVAAAMLAEDARVPWYGPSMGAKSFLTARLMECWAHGQDVVDALGIQRPGTDRLRHVAQLGFLTRSWSYANRGLAVPEAEVRLQLASPSGELWRFGPDDAPEAVAGPALDFCLVVTQRRHPGDTALTATPLAREWLEIAQAFAGPPTDGPEPDTRIVSSPGGGGQPERSEGRRGRYRSREETERPPPPSASLGVLPPPGGETTPPRPLLSTRAEAALGDRHRAVLDELEELFLTEGFAAVTMRELAAHLRCSLRTLYELAPSKQRLVLMVLDRFLHRVGRHALAAIDPAEPVPDRIRAYFVGAAELQRRTAAFAEDSAGEPEMLRLLDRHFNYVTSVLERLIAEGIDRGELRPVDPRIAAAALSGTAMFIARPDIVAYLGGSSPAVIADATDVVLEGLVERQPLS